MTEQEIRLDQTKKVFKSIANLISNNKTCTYRYLIYDILGFNSGDYVDLLDGILITNMLVDYNDLKDKNKRLKEKLNCKEYFSSTMPENTEFVILTKENYDRQQKDIELELIDYKSRNEKAIEYIKQLEHSDWITFGRKILLDILNGDSNE